MKEKENIVFITNIPVPYREKLHEKLYAYYGEKYSVVYCSKIEQGRLWKVRTGHYRCQFLSESETSFGHYNWNVINRLRKLSPQTIILPMELKITFILCLVYAIFNKTKIIYYTDATKDSESHYSKIRVFCRKLQCRIGKAFICISNGGEELYKHYGVALDKIFRSRLCADEQNFIVSDTEKKYDLIYSAYIREGKLPLFFKDIAVFAQKLLKKRKIRILIVGDGEKRSFLLEELDKAKIDYTYAGFASQKELPIYYNQSKILIFTTRRDAWGVVANEAMMCGLPVIVSTMAGCANDLVLDNVNGYVLPNDNPKQWAEKIVELLNDSTKYIFFSKNALSKAKDYTFDAAAKGIIEAIHKS